MNAEDPITIRNPGRLLTLTYVISLSVIAVLSLVVHFMLDEVISEHANDPNGVLLSSSLWEGVDLKDDLSRFQIIAKVPYPNYKEKRTKAKMDKFPMWYTSQTLTKLLQGFGRSIRSEDDWAKTYVLDTAVNNVFFKAQQMIPKAYYDVLGIENL